MAYRTVLLAVSMVLALGDSLALDIHGHRGARGLAPENTLASFEAALAEGATTLELDVFLSADKVVVVHHDPALNADLTRGPDRTWLSAPGPLVRSLSLSQLRSYDVGRAREGGEVAKAFPLQRPADGQRIPALSEVFDLVKSSGAPAVRLNIEIKQNPYRPGEHDSVPDLVQAVLADIERAGMAERVMIQSFNWEVMRRVRDIAPRIATGYLTLQSGRGPSVNDPRWTAGLKLADHGNSVPRLVKAAGGSIWTPNFRDLSADIVKEAQALGIKVIPWTVNEIVDMERLLNWGVDGLITDYPDRARVAAAAAPKKR